MPVKFIYVVITSFFLDPNPLKMLHEFQETIIEDNDIICTI